MGQKQRQAYSWGSSATAVSRAMNAKKKFSKEIKSAA